MKRLVVAFLSSVFLVSIASARADEASRPNIVFLLIDDLGYADCGFNGGAVIQTPNIDKLARQGAVLESQYVQPVCSPTRAALMTGRYATHTGVYTVVRPHAKWGLPLQERTLADALRQAGYSTAIVGKWHLGEFDRAYLPTNRGFDHQYGHYFGALDYFTKIRGRDYDWHRNDKEVKEDGYTTHLLTQEACRQIEAQPKSKPLFLYIPFNAVHAPLQVPENYLEPYGNLTGGRRQLAGMLSAVDESIGKIVASLEKAGMRDNTLIVFSADNGGPRPGTNTPLRDFKGTIYEGGVRGCAFANWPGRIPAGQRIKQPMHVIDWYPTLLKLAGGSLEQKLSIDGKDVWPMLTENAPSPHDSILCVQSPTRSALRMGDWKLIRFDASAAGTGRPKNRKIVTSETLELYDLANDIGETRNLADHEPERVALMRAKLDEYLKDAVPAGNQGDDGSE